jgi:hypothetical protein
VGNVNVGGGVLVETSLAFMIRRRKVGLTMNEAGKGAVLQQEQDGLGNSEMKEKDTLQKS